MTSLVFETRPERELFASILQLVTSAGSSNTTPSDFNSMEDISTPAVPNILDAVRMEGNNKLHERTEIRQVDVESVKESDGDCRKTYFPAITTTYKPPVPNAGRVPNRRAPKHDAKKPYPSQLQSVDESLTLPLTEITGKPPRPLHSDGEHTTASTATERPTFTEGSQPSTHIHTSQIRRKSLDIAIASTAGGKKRLKRTQSLWATSLDPEYNSHHDAETFRAEVKMNEKERLLIVKRARKIAQVFGHEAPTQLITGMHDDCLFESQRSSTQTRDSPTPGELGVDKPLCRSNSASSSGSGTSSRLNTSESPPDGLDERASSPLLNDATSQANPLDRTTFQERRRRAAKLSRFFGVDYQDISTSLNTPGVKRTIPKPTDGFVMTPVEVDVKVAGRRFWGLVDGRDELKNADVADVIDRLRDLRAS